MLVYQSEKQNRAKMADIACTGLVGRVRLFEHFQRPEQFSACRVNQRPAHPQVTQTVSVLFRGKPLHL